MRTTPRKKRSKAEPRKESRSMLALRQALSSRSKRAIARKLDASPSHINRVLNGQRDCSIPLARRLAAELGLELAVFLDATRVR